MSDSILIVFVASEITYPGHAHKYTSYIMPISPTGNRQASVLSARLSLHLNHEVKVSVMNTMSDAAIMRMYIRMQTKNTPEQAARHDLAVSYGHRPVDIALFSPEEIVARHEEALQRDADAAARGPDTPGTPGRPRVTSPVDAVAKKPRKSEMRNLKKILVENHGVSDEALAAMNPWEIALYAQTLGIHID
jgi:hypothetical protein